MSTTFQPRRSQRISQSSLVRFPSEARSPTPGKLNRVSTPGRLTETRTTYSNSQALHSVPSEDEEEDEGRSSTSFRHHYSLSSTFPKVILLKDSTSPKGHRPVVLHPPPSSNSLSTRASSYLKTHLNKAPSKTTALYILNGIVLLSLLAFGYKAIPWTSLSSLALADLRFMAMVAPDFLLGLFLPNHSSSEEFSNNLNIDLIVDKILSHDKFDSLFKELQRRSSPSQTEDKINEAVASLDRSQEIRDSVQQLQERMLSNKASLEGQFTSLREQFTELQSLKEETHRLELEAFERKLSELNDKLGSVKDLLLRSEGIVHKCEATVKTISAQTNISIRDYVEDLIHDNSSELSMHLQKHFVSQKDMSVLVNDMKTQLKVEEELLPGHRHSLSQQNHVTSLVEAALVKYDADKTGMFDFALESAGGTIISTRCTETYDDAWAVHSILGIPFWWERNNPRTILNPSSNPGECWAFKGSQGSVVVGLSQPVKVEAFSLEHISKMMAPDRKIPSAPRRFTVLGLSSLSDESPFVFGNFTYDDNGSPVQTFIVPAYLPPVKLVELKVLSNYGHLVYTCVYRIRVHGAFAGPENNLS